MAGNAVARAGSRRTVAGLVACAALIEAGLAGILLLARPASEVPAYLSFYLAISVPYLTACWLVTRGRPALQGKKAVRWIWAAALLFRLTALPLEPSLSEDSARYRWQGIVQDRGGDPYLAIPEDSRWADLRDETWARVSTKDKPSAYGPVLEQVNLWWFRFVSLVDADPWGQVWLFKLPFAMADLSVGLALMALLPAVGRPRAWALVYLWSPLAVTEFWMEGHNDAWAVALVTASLALAAHRRPQWAAAALAAATMCKFWPAVLAPFLLVRRRETTRRCRIDWRASAVFVAVAVALCVPYLPSVFKVRAVLEGLMGDWRNNDSLFGLFAQLAGGDPGLAADLAKWTVILAVGAIWLMRLPPVLGELSAISAVLLLSANCFPWYLTWMLPLLAVHPLPSLLLWTALVPLAYHVVPAYEAAGIWQYDSLLIWAEYAPVLGWLAAAGAMRAIRGARSGEVLGRIRRTSPDGR